MEPNKKIAIIADPLDNQHAGVHVFTKELINGIIELGQADRFLLIRQKKDPDLPIEQIAVPTIHLPIGYASMRLFFIIPYLLRKHQVSVVFEPAHFGPFNLPRSIKRITMIHDLTPLLFPQYHRWHSQVLQRIFLPSILRKTDWIITNSKHTKQDVVQCFPFSKEKISHLYLGKHHSFKPVYNKLIINNLQINTPYFLFVGTLEPRKNLLLLLRAFKTFCIKNKASFQLVLVGSMGWKNEELKKVLEAHPYRENIKQLGYVDAAVLPVVYTHAKALIYPSQYEGFGLPIIEAMACGTNVITARNSSLKEIGEEVAFFFNTQDEKDLHQQMEEVIKYPVSKELLIAHAEKFSWLDCAKGFIDQCERIVV